MFKFKIYDVPESPTGFSVRWVRERVSQSVSRSVGQPTEQSVSQSVSQSVGQPTERSVSQSTERSGSQPVGPSAEAVSQSASQSVCQPSRQSVCLSVISLSVRESLVSRAVDLALQLQTSEYGVPNRQMRGRV